MSGGCSKRGVAGRAGCRVRGMRTTCKERPRTAGRGRPWQPCGRDASASRHLRLGTRPWFGCMRCAQGRPGRCCVWSARPSRPSGAAPVPFRRSFSDFWLENDFLFWPFYRLFYLTPPFRTFFGSSLSSFFLTRETLALKLQLQTEFMEYVMKQ